MQCVMYDLESGFVELILPAAYSDWDLKTQHLLSRWGIHISAIFLGDISPSDFARLIDHSYY